jgi:hypothetical protein
MTLYELHEYIGEAIQNGMANHVVVFGDCNTMHKVGTIGEGFVEDITEYFLEEVEEGTPVYVLSE